MILLDPKLCFWQNDIDYISGEIWQPPLVRCQKLSWRGFCTHPSFLFSFSSFHFYINLTLECYSTHTAGHQESVWGGWVGVGFKENFETLSYPLPPSQASLKSQTLTSQFKLAKPKWSLLANHARVFLLTWAFSKGGWGGDGGVVTLHESGTQFIHRLILAQRDA